MGVPSKKRIGLFGKVVIAIVAVGVISSMLPGTGSRERGASGADATTPAPTPPPPQKSPAEIIADNQLKEATAGVIALRNAMRNPDSFRLEEVLAMSGPAECITYRAQNGFGGLNVEEAVIRSGTLIPHSSSQFDSQWNRYCAEKTGHVITDNVKRLVEIIAR